MYKNQLLVAVVSSILWLPLSHAFYSVQDTGELLEPEDREVSAEVQFITQGEDGANFVGRFDLGVDEQSNARVTAGFGTTDFFVSGSYKWVPFPDVDSQPAIGFIFGALYARYEDENELSIRVTPIASKKFETDIGKLTPYAALPIGLRNYNDDTEVPMNLALGSRYAHPDLDFCDFTLELGLDLTDSFGYIAVGIVKNADTLF